MEKVLGTVQEPVDIVVARVRGRFGRDATVGRRDQYHVRHHHRGDGGVRAGVPFGEESAGVDETGAAILPLVPNRKKNPKYRLTGFVLTVYARVPLTRSWPGNWCPGTW